MLGAASPVLVGGGAVQAELGGVLLGGMNLPSQAMVLGEGKLIRVIESWAGPAGFPGRCSCQPDSSPPLVSPMLQFIGGDSGESVGEADFPIELEHVLLLEEWGGVRLFGQEVQQHQHQSTGLFRQGLDSREKKLRIHRTNLPAFACGTKP